MRQDEACPEVETDDAWSTEALFALFAQGYLSDAEQPILFHQLVLIIPDYDDIQSPPSNLQSST